jgi:hypothetical protein
MARAASLLLLLGGLLAADAWAQQTTYKGLWEAIDRSACVPESHPDFILVTCAKDRTLWYFSRASHPAHPAVLKRTITQRGDDIFVETSGWPFGAPETRPAFQTWLTQMKAQDQKLRDEMKQPAR